MKRSFETLDEAYHELSSALTNFAKKHLANRDQAIDAVHDAFTKAAEYAVKHPDCKFKRFYFYRETIRACRRLNQKNYQLTSPVPLPDSAVGKRVLPKGHEDAEDTGTRE